MTKTFRSRTTKIEWTQHTWNPIRGCTPISAGCDNCYAERMAKRFPDRTGPFNRHFEPTMIPERLDEPLRWKKPRMVFVGSMGDLFHDSITDRFIYSIFLVMKSADKHIFQLLTKRPVRMKQFIDKWIADPLPNVWLGVTCENQKAADERIPLLLETSAAVRYVSCEPLLSNIDLRGWTTKPQFGKLNQKTNTRPYEIVGRNDLLNWVIVGGETGPGARECKEDWVQSVYDQCQAAQVPFFFKSAGKNYSNSNCGNQHCGYAMPTQKQCIDCISPYWEARREWPKSIIGKEAIL